MRRRWTKGGPGVERAQNKRDDSQYAYLEIIHKSEILEDGYLLVQGREHFSLAELRSVRLRFGRQSGLTASIIFGAYNVDDEAEKTTR